MQDALHVDAHVAEEIAFRRRGAKRETEGEGRRRGKRGMSRSTRRRLVEIDGVGLARRMGEEFELALFDIDMARLGGESLEADRKSTRSELQSLMRISYAVFCLKKKTQQPIRTSTTKNNTL